MTLSYSNPIQIDSRREVVHGLPISITYDRHFEDVPGQWCVRDFELDGGAEDIDAAAFSEWLLDNDLMHAIARNVEGWVQDGGDCYFYGTYRGMRLFIDEPPLSADSCVGIEQVLDFNTFSKWVHEKGFVEQFAEEVGK